MAHSDVRNIFCIGRNYAEHAKELGNAIPTEPVVFLKPTSSLVTDGSAIRLPARSQRVDHEVELVLRIGRGGPGAGGYRDLSESAALACVDAVAIGIDVTARDLQDAAKAKGLPWEVSKGFDTFAQLGPWHAVEPGFDWAGLGLSLLVNGEQRQHGTIEQMIFSVPQVLVYLSSVFTLAPGDIVYTGTPSGVSPIKAGDRLEAELRTGSGGVLSRYSVGVTASSLNS